jgi:hypothetical protein
MPRQGLEALAKGEGLWRQLSPRDRRRQLEQIAALASAYYPNYRLFLFDQRQTSASPYTIFGNHRAAVYMGGIFIVFTAADMIRELTLHFEELVRQAVIQPATVPSFVQRLLRDMG